ncbi:MAG: cobalamin B12-binding domain-containing protein [Firmicutes bacterium]|nr:cobalamin B12-binding domain-containing protein [Bacillota bacterium]
MTKKKVLLAPVDPVHDVGLKMIRRALQERGHEAILLAPDLPVEEILREIARSQPDFVFLSRTLGYGVTETLARIIDLADFAGLREKTRFAVGGMAIRPQLAAELGFDRGFGPKTTVEEAVAYVEGRKLTERESGPSRAKRNLSSNYSYQFKHPVISQVLTELVARTSGWAAVRTSPGVKRALLRQKILQVTQRDETSPIPEPVSLMAQTPLTPEAPFSQRRELHELRRQYAQLAGGAIRAYYDQGDLPPKTRSLSKEELAFLTNLANKGKGEERQLHLPDQRPLIFVQYGTGCPFMDIAHIKLAEAWGADGVIHFDPSWGARAEGLLEGNLSHEEDGSILTPQNLAIIQSSLTRGTLWQVRAHRGLNTPETVVLAGELGADLTKINIAYGSLGGGTDPDRLVVDGYQSMKLAAAYGLPYDVVTNEELAGVPAHKALAGMLISAALGITLGGRPILQPLFAYSPEVMIGGQMDDNYVDFNAAKILALREIIDAPLWPGAPVGFLTQSEDRVQSSLATSLHAMLAASMGVEAITIASSDEAYSGGPISAASRVDTLRAVAEGFRFLGAARIQHTDRAREWADKMVHDIEEVLEKALEAGSLRDALYQGVLGSQEDGAYPGRAGRGTVREIS